MTLTSYGITGFSNIAILGISPGPITYTIELRFGFYIYHYSLYNINDELAIVNYLLNYGNKTILSIHQDMNYVIRLPSLFVCSFYIFLKLIFTIFTYFHKYLI